VSRMGARFGFLSILSVLAIVSEPGVHATFAQTAGVPAQTAGVLAGAAATAARNSVAITAPGRNYRIDADAAMAALYGWYNPTTGLWTSTGWWNSANALEATIDHASRTGATAYLGILPNTFDLHRSTNFLNHFYDDEGWWALAWVKAYDLTGETRYLDMAKTIFADMTTGWDNTCDGGVWWNKDRHYKNAIANELFLTLAARLHQRTWGDEGPRSYLDWAEREWAWFQASGMIDADNRINDGLNQACQNNHGTTWTYNQGVILGGLVELSAATGDATLIDHATSIADAALATLTNTDGVLVEPCEPSCGGDGSQFKGIFVRNLSVLYEAARARDDATHAARYRRFITRNADAIWTRGRNTSYQLGLRWAGPFDSADASRQSSAMDALNAAIPFSRHSRAGLNLARGKAVDSSPACSDAEDASRAVDGSIVRGSKWCSPGASGQWLQVDLGRRMLIQRFTIRHAAAGGERDGFNTRDFTISMSNDGEEWHQVLEVHDNTHSQTFHAIHTRRARYVRLDVLTAQTDPNQQAARIYEFDVYGPGSDGGDPTPNPENLARFAAASANGACSSSQRADFAVDGTLGSKWCATATDGNYRLQIDLGAPTAIGRIVLKHAGAGGEAHDRNTRDFTLEASADGEEWTTLATVVGNVDDVTTHTFEPTSAQFVRLSISAPQTSPNSVAARIYEMELYPQ
jgi:predicted alpha-1,6-mannanase (GH76 family)